MMNKTKLLLACLMAPLVGGAAWAEGEGAAARPDLTPPRLQAASLKPTHFEPSLAFFYKLDAVRGVIHSSEGELIVNPSTKVVIDGKLAGYGSAPFKGVKPETPLLIQYDDSGKVLLEVWIITEPLE